MFKLFQTLPVLYADKNNANCKVKGLRAFYLLTDKEDQLDMLNAWIKCLIDARKKITEVPRPVTQQETIKEILTVPAKQEEAKKQMRSIYMAINAQKTKDKRRQSDLIENHLREHKQITVKEAVRLFGLKSGKSLPSIIYTLRKRNMAIVNRVIKNGLFEERAYIFMGDVNVANSQGS